MGKKKPDNVKNNQLHYDAFKKICEILGDELAEHPDYLNEIYQHLRGEALFSYIVDATAPVDYFNLKKPKQLAPALKIADTFPPEPPEEKENEPMIKTELKPNGKVNKSKLVRDYLKTFPELGNAALKAKLAKDYPELKINDGYIATIKQKSKGKIPGTPEKKVAQVVAAKKAAAPIRIDKEGDELNDSEKLALAKLVIKYGPDAVENYIKILKGWKEEE